MPLLMLLLALSRFAALVLLLLRTIVHIVLCTHFGICLMLLPCFSCEHLLQGGLPASHNRIQDPVRAFDGI